MTMTSTHPARSSASIRRTRHSVVRACVLLAALVSSRESFAQGDTGLQLSDPFLIAGALATADSDTNKPGRPGIAFGGSDYLVVSCRDTGSPAGMIGTLVSTSGNVGSEFLVADINPIFGCSGQRPSIAFDGTNYLVAFSRAAPDGSTDIVGARVSRTGARIGTTEGFVILSNSGGAPAVAFDGANYLVVTTRFNSTTMQDIIGARVTQGGTVLGEFAVFTAPGGQVQPSVAFDGTNYLVVWSDTRTGSPIGPDADIIGTRVSPAGVVLDPAGRAISTAPGAQAAPHLTFSAGMYFVVWEDTRNGSTSFPPQLDIFGTRVTPSVTVIDGLPATGGIAINTSPVPQQHPAVTFDGTDFVVTWDVAFFYNPPVGIYAARVSRDGVLLDGPVNEDGVLVSAPACFACRLVHPNIAAGDNGAMIAWVLNSEVSGQAKEVHGALVQAPQAPGPTPFAALDATIVHARTSRTTGAFAVDARAQLGAASDGIAPESESVVISLADAAGHTFEQTLEPGSLRKVGSRTFVFVGRAPGIRDLVLTFASGADKFTVRLLATDVPVIPARNSDLIFSIAIGDDTGNDASTCRRGSAGVLVCR